MSDAKATTSPYVTMNAVKTAITPFLMPGIIILVVMILAFFLYKYIKKSSGSEGFSVRAKFKQLLKRQSLISSALG